jgi:chromosomal replication initiator protein
LAGLQMTNIVDNGQVWQRIAARLRAELGEDLYSSWFGRMEMDQQGGGKLVVSVPTRFLKSWIEGHYLAKLRSLAETELGPLDAVLVKVRGVPVMAQRPSSKPWAHGAVGSVAKSADQGLVSIMTDRTPGGTHGTLGMSVTDPQNGGDESQTFETFVVGASNQLAHAAASRVASSPGMIANPLYIHAPAGLGKTHLLNSIAQRVKTHAPQRRVMVLTAERFMYHFINAVRQRDTLTFKDQFQAVDLLLIDDFQFLQGKAIQQEFCHSFNALVDSRRQVVVAADVPPSQLDAIDQRMRSRLVGGLVIDIELPDEELRRKILAMRYATMRQSDPGLIVSEEVLDLIAHRISGGGRELEGALNRVAAYQQFNSNAIISLDLAAMVLRDAATPVEPGRVKIEDIMKVIGRHFNVAKSDLLSPRRARNIVMPRQIGMYLSKKLTSRSLPEIGRRFGGRDHSTVLHAVRKIDDRIRTDEKLAKEVALLIRLVEQNG